MRLLNTKTLEFKEFFDRDIPEYAILSHRWDQSEVSYQDFRHSRSKAGSEYEKVLKCCAFAAKREHTWIWIDTCCIDKSSSADLSEAINSMYRYYENAVECYAYLNDVCVEEWTEQFPKSRWFTRGWTLQELLAPRRVRFLDRDWKRIGTKESLADIISKRTGIPMSYVQKVYPPSHASVAMRMSWASRRETSRLEDRAYSLLGLFGVNMPLLYGEGHNAFYRLQLEILRISDDESIFAWQDGESHLRIAKSMLSTDIADFALSDNIVTLQDWVVDRPSYSMTNKGLKIHVPRSIVNAQSEIVLPINCRRKGDDQCLAIRLVLTKGLWARADSSWLLRVPRVHLWAQEDCLFPNKSTIYVSELVLPWEEEDKSAKQQKTLKEQIIAAKRKSDPIGQQVWLARLPKKEQQRPSKLAEMLMKRKPPG